MEHKVQLIADEGIFRGLAKQNMLFHQCVCELVDNGIAATNPDEKFHIEIHFHETENRDVVDLLISDAGNGMSLEHLKSALQLGKSPTSQNRLNEHGFGLKNSLATLSGSNGVWKIWTKDKLNANSKIALVEGPFKGEMVIHDDVEFPELGISTTDISTLIKVSVSMRFLQTLQGRGAPTTNTTILREWLIEHLGVLYRGYLEQDTVTNENSGVIYVSIGNDRIKVPPVQVPFGNLKREYFDVTLNGNPTRIEYIYGSLDETKRDQLIRGRKSKFYYQQNIPSQGIDIRLGKRVIATRQIETIWKTDGNSTQLSRHNEYNDFVGELLIPELPRGCLTTVNTKTDFNLDDNDWSLIFTELNKIRPPRKIREHSESEIRDKWQKMLKSTNRDDTISGEMSVWSTGTRIDVYRKTDNGKIIIYEIKVGMGTSLHLYQLKMYWDGLVMDKNEDPNEAILLVGDFTTNLEQMANVMNQMRPPKDGNPYNFKIEKLSDKGLTSAR